MRTTVTIDPDVEALLKQAVRRRREPFKRVLNDALREGLRQRKAPAEPYRQPVFDMGRPLVDLTKGTALAAELEDQDLIAKLRAGR